MLQSRSRCLLQGSKPTTTTRSTIMANRSSEMTSMNQVSAISTSEIPLTKMTTKVLRVRQMCFSCSPNAVIWLTSSWIIMMPRSMWRLICLESHSTTQMSTPKTLFWMNRLSWTTSWMTPSREMLSRYHLTISAFHSSKKVSGSESSQAKLKRWTTSKLTWPLSRQTLASASSEYLKHSKMAAYWYQLVLLPSHVRWLPYQSTN